MIPAPQYSPRKVSQSINCQYSTCISLCVYWDEFIALIGIHIIWITLLNATFFLGRLYQVEYAMEAISHAGTCLGILANDGILLAAERRNINKLLDEVFFSEKIYKLTK